MRRCDKVLQEYREKFDARCMPYGRKSIYSDIIQCMGAEQFTWKELPETINSHWTERAVNGSLAAFYEVPDGISSACKGFTVTPAEFVGVPNQIGETSKIITTGSDYAIEFDLTVDKVVIIKNNDYLYNEYNNLMWFADMLAKTDISEKALIIWSKIHPIAKATSGVDGEKLKNVIETILRDSDCECDTYNIIDDNTRLITGGTPVSRDDAVLRLGDENAVEKMHFLSEFHYELIKRLCNLYGIPFRSNAKSAQSLESELHNTDIFSQIMNMNRLKCRKEAAEKINAMFGLNVTVDYSEILKKENRIIDSNVKQEENEAGEDVRTNAENSKTGNSDTGDTELHTE
mgnify:CR=1 FL=1